METAKAQLPDLNNVSYLSGRMARQRIGEAHHIERGKKHGGWHQKERKQQCDDAVRFKNTECFSLLTGSLEFTVTAG